MADELVERIARAIAGTRGHDWAALDGSYGGRVVRVQIMREVDALLPIINAEIAAERERCAVIGYITCAETRHVTLGNKVREAINRSQPCKN